MLLLLRHIDLAPVIGPRFPSQQDHFEVEALKEALGPIHRTSGHPLSSSPNQASLVQLSLSQQTVDDTQLELAVHRLFGTAPQQSAPVLFPLHA